MATTATIPLAELAQTAIAKYLKQAARYEKAVLADIDPENLHQMRVGLRRLRTALQVFAPAIDIPAAGQSRQVGKVARRLGHLRDLDVVIDTLQHHYLPNLPDSEQVVLKQVIEQLQHQRRTQFKRIKKLLRGKRYCRLKDALQGWLAEPIWGAIAALPAAQSVPDLVLPLASQTWLHPGWLVGTTISQTAVKIDPKIGEEQVDGLILKHSATLHSLRKQIKRFRYQLKVVSELYGDRLDPALDHLAAIQENLGQLQDSFILGTVLAQTSPHPHRTMPTLFALMSDQRHQAWKAWQQLQQHSLDPDYRSSLRRELASPSALKSDAPARTRDEVTEALPVEEAKPAPSESSSTKIGEHFSNNGHHSDSKQPSS